ncbi:MAG: aldehyde dehydrogenase family protein [Actinobacteria bacterium]|nr:aldehyde dehydrogenase family protein [Actinomycetota bacterium]
MTDVALDALGESASEKVVTFLNSSDRHRKRRDRANRKRFARLLKDPAAVAVTMGLTDEVIRISDKRKSAQAFRRLAKAASIQLGVIDYLGIKLAAPISLLLPRLTMAIVRKRVEIASHGIILNSQPKKLSKHIDRRKADSAQLNINVLGEAVLGDREAHERFKSVSEMLQRDEVNYVSVKISSIISQIITIDHAGSVARVGERLRDLYRIAARKNAFINLDMEEYRDLAITVDVFKEILDEPEFERLNAGIVLQAYLPESHEYFDELVDWARARYARAGGTIKIRLVKGANLAMEKAEAQLHGYSPAPYRSKADVDASYVRLIDTALRTENYPAVRIGVASHNLFHIAWAIDVAKARGVAEQLDIEMLEGMANAEALSLAQSQGKVLLYTPVTKLEDFPSAVAYLVRRLDENTSTENYLRASFTMKAFSSEFSEQKRRFLKSLSDRHTIATKSLRHGVAPIHPAGFFQNESDGDLTDPKLVQAIAKSIKGIKAISDLHIPVVVNGKEIQGTITEPGIDPNNNGQTWYRYSVIERSDVDRAIASAKAAVSDWDGIGAEARSAILNNAAQIMSDARAQTIAVMARDAGKTVSEADPEVSEAIDFARYYAHSAVTMAKGSHPVGVVLVVPPWNFPYAIPMGGICAALAAGNTVLLKPAPETVAVAWTIVNHLWQAGVPKNVLHFLPSRDDENGKYLVSHSDINSVILTGGFETARLFLSWKPDMPLMAETSGKNSIIISASADIDAAVKDLVTSAFGHAGQKCSAASLAIVEASIYENPSFIRQLEDAVTSLSVGSGMDFGTTVGPIIRPAEGALHRALTTLDDDESWLVAPQQLDDAGHLWRPGVKVGVKPGSWSHHNEWFGPVLGVMKAPNLERAIAWQSDVPYGLTAGIHSLNTQECEEWINKVQAGNLYINRGITGAIVNRQPFGGWKRSSVGATSKAGGPHYVEQLRNWNLVQDVNSTKRGAVIWWERTGSKARECAGLEVERNYQRFLRYDGEIVVRFDSSTSHEERAFVEWLSHEHGISIVASEHESIVELLEFIDQRKISKVRWLSGETAPAVELLDRGISLDSRPIAQTGGVELTRWLREQSIAITNHRYGNVGAGPQPKVS